MNTILSHKSQKMIKSRLLLFTLCIVPSLLLFSCKKKGKLDPVCDGGTATYNADVKQIIDANCTNSSCHGSGSSRGDWTSYSGLQTVINNGQFNQRVLVDQTMPKGNRTLSQEDINTIQCWVDNGYAEN